MSYTVKQLSELTGLTPRTLRYYDAIGLLRPARDGANDYRRYGPAEVERLRQILIYRELGLPLTLFRLSRKDEICVLEMGMNHFGEIDYLTSLECPGDARPGGGDPRPAGRAGGRPERGPAGTFGPPPGQAAAGGGAHPHGPPHTRRLRRRNSHDRQGKI